MKIQEPTLVPAKYKILLAILSIIGIFVILISTYNYGARLSPDSVGYIAAARNIASGVGVVNFDDKPLVLQPPLYPAILSFYYYVFGIDPLLSANVINSILFGMIIYTGGIFFFKYSALSPAFAMLGALALLFSKPIFKVSTWAWSEPLFILIVLLSFIFSYSYIVKKDLVSLILFSITVALSCLTRYIGVTLILWGALNIIFSHRDIAKKKILSLLIFLIISTIPILIWIIRNYVISGTLTGPRASSAFGLAFNINLLTSNILYWYIPKIIPQYYHILIVVGLGFVFLIGLNFTHSWQDLKVSLQQMTPIFLFTIIYITFLIFSSTTIAFDIIDDRLLSPIYFPITVFLLIFFQVFVSKNKIQSTKRNLSYFFIIYIVIGFIYLFFFILLKSNRIILIGQGFEGKMWKESKTIQYLLNNQTSLSKSTIYSNCPEVIYIYTNIKSQITPAKTKHNSFEIDKKISDLIGFWPEKSNAIIIWFEKHKLDLLFNIDEIKEFAELELISKFEDGAIYSAKKRPIFYDSLPQ